MPAYGSPPPPMAAYAPPPSELARRFNPKVIASFVMVIITLIVTVIAGSMAWWSLTATITNLGVPTTVSVDFLLGSACVSGGAGFGGIGTICLPYGLFSGFGAIPPAFTGTFGVASALMLVGLLMAFLMIVFVIVGALLPRLAIINVALGLTGMVVTLVAPIYVFFALPSAFGGSFGGGIGTPNTTGFFGSFTDPLTSTSARWGGGLGWFMAFGVFALFLVSTILAVSARKSLASMGNYRVAQAPAYAQPMYWPSMPPAYAPPTYPTYPPYTYPQAPAYTYPQAPAYQVPPIPSNPPPVPQAPLDRFCGTCGNTVPVGITICSRCGAYVA